jgi:hypothetical protein
MLRSQVPQKRACAPLSAAKNRKSAHVRQQATAKDRKSKHITCISHRRQTFKNAPVHGQNVLTHNSQVMYPLYKENLAKPG